MALPVSRFSIVAVFAALCTIALVAIAGPGAGTAQAQSACKKWGNQEAKEIRPGHARKAVLCLVNAERNQRGLPDFDRDKRLQRAAQKHNDVMQNKNCFSHQCPGEASLTTRLRGVGYLVSGLLGWSYGENIAWGEQHLATPKSIVRAWMNSSGHRANILSRTFKDFGVGYSRGTINKDKANGAVYTTDFGYRRG